MKIGYARVSKAEDQDAGAQLEALKRAGCRKVFVDQAPGNARDRPQLAAALKTMKGGDQFIVWKVDRLSRSLLQLLELMIQIDGAGVSFRSLSENVDTSQPIGRALLQLLGTFAELEHSMIRERTRLGLAHARRHGRILGRRRLMNDDQVTAAKELLQGRTIAHVANALLVSPSTLKRELKRARDRATLAALQQGAQRAKKSQGKAKKKRQTTRAGRRIARA
jgi:DNA invertase Pin-like site-specific DNA recombinase